MLALADTEGERLADGDVLALGLRLALADTEGDRLLLGLSDADGLTEGEALMLAEIPAPGAARTMI